MIRIDVGQATWVDIFVSLHFVLGGIVSGGCFCLLPDFISGLRYAVLCAS